MFIANDTNYTFGQFLAADDGDDIKAPGYSKCFTDTESLKGYRFIHDPEETDPEKCVCFSVYSDTASEATATAFGGFAAVSDLMSVMFRFDASSGDTALRDVPYYHVIIPVENIADETEIKYLVIKMTKEVEIFPENYPYYELVDTFADAEPTSAEAPSSGITPTGTVTITENDTYDVTNYASAAVNVTSDYSAVQITFINVSEYAYNVALPKVANEKMSYVELSNQIEVEANSSASIDLVVYKNSAVFAINSTDIDTASAITTTGSVEYDSDNGIVIVSGNGTISGSGTQPW